ncbi:CoA-binding domain-containing protein [Mycena chlorophos]|uniref:CoA-binding domain-containing protein n=1 Tax=Mycena chlorophos TaxID=658473 RepID=A0A8H6S2K0_MYCCL|nr:CoA-binding domain-containing protein [Mycena chlorophos]
MATTTTAAATLLTKRIRFLSAPKFAVVGASNDSKKFGFKDLKWLLDHKKDVVPINLKPGKIQGIECYQSLSQLPDPKHTAVVIVVPPKSTLDVLKQAKSLGMFAYWLQPGSEDSDVVKYIQSDADLDAQSLYDDPLHKVAPEVTTQAAEGSTSSKLHILTGPTCSGIVMQGSAALDAAAEQTKKVAASTTSKIASAATTVAEKLSTAAEKVSAAVEEATSPLSPAPAVNNVVAGVKRPRPSPSPEPQPAKSVKLAPDNTA